jgi:hypothetical protein
MSSILAPIVSSLVAIATWVAFNFAAEPVLALRKTRQEALGIADKFWAVNSSWSDEGHRNAISAPNGAAAALAEQRRADAVAVRKYCDWLGYDLELAARCLRGLAEGVRDEYSVSDETRKRTRDALFVSLGATRDLSAAEITAATEAIAAARREDESAAP